MRGRVLAVTALCGALAAAQPAHGQRVQLRFRPSQGAPVKYHEHFECWPSFGHYGGAPAMVIDVWRTETANQRGDSVLVVAVVDSAKARSPGAPAEMDPMTRMMRGARDSVFYDQLGHELARTSHGTTESDLLMLITEGVPIMLKEYQQWRQLPPDSVAVGGSWSNSIRIIIGASEWLGPVEYRLRQVQQRDGRAVARLTTSGTLRTDDRSLAPLRVASESVVDAETGQLVEATVREEGAFMGRPASFEVRNNWRIERVR